MIPQKYETISSLDIIPLETSQIPKLEGFRKLTDLHVAQNNIQTIDELIGIVFLASLERIYLEGNPIMITNTPTFYAKSSSEGFELFNYLKSHGILITDPCYSSPFKVAPSLSFKMERSIIKKKKGPREFLHKSVKVSSGNMAAFRHVYDLPQIQSLTVKEKSEKRHYQFSEKDMQVIVKSGKIPSVKSLMQYANEKESKPKQEHPKIVEELAEIEEIDDSETDDIDEDLIYDPNQPNDTFITGIHITGSGASEIKVIEQGEQEFKHEYDENDYDSPLPPNIMATSKALRQALKNPGSYWRVAGKTHSYQRGKK